MPRQWYPMNLALEILEYLPGEIAHHYESHGGDCIFSQGNRFFGTCKGLPFEFHVPISGAAYLKSITRISRRLFRTDKSNACFNFSRDGIVVLYASSIYFFDIRKNKLMLTAQLRQCRNVLHGGVAISCSGVYFGEYGANPGRESVPVWSSHDDGRSWNVVHQFPAGSIKHVHGVYTDPYTNSLWIPTGDFENECFIYEVPGADFTRMQRHGNGRQEWRTVGMFFEHERIVWGMDSQLQTSYLQFFNRKTGNIKQGSPFPGPIWYCKKLEDGLHFIQSTVEIGIGSQSNFSHVFVSNDLENWHEVSRHEKDLFPKRLFKFGVIAFADGKQDSQDFVIFGEALKGLDGKVLRVRLAST